MSPSAQFALTAVVIAASMFAGYGCRRLRLLPEKVAEYLMTFVAVVGYPVVGLLAIWAIRLGGADFWLPGMMVSHVAIMALLGILVARFMRRSRTETGMFSVLCGAGNNGFTMGGFVLYLLYGEQGLGLANIYFVLFAPAVILMLYPIARHHGEQGSQGGLARLLLRSIFDWRSIGLPLAALAVWLSVTGVPRPAIVADWHLVDIFMYTLTPMAYFGIGLRLHLGDLAQLKSLVAALAGVRFVLAAGVGLLQVLITYLTPWPVEWGSLSARVVIIESFVPTAVTSVAVANMFHLLPRQASVLFVVNTLMYLVLVLPVVLWLFG